MMGHSGLKKIANGLLLIVVMFMVEACGPKTEAQESCTFVQNSFGQRVSWKGKLPIKLYIHDSVPKEFHGAIEAAAVQWDSALGSRPLFEIAGVISHGSEPVQDGASVIYLREDWDGHKIGEQARTTIFWKGNEIQEADIQLNARDFKFATGENLDGNKVDMESLVVHEIGHVLGLTHTSEGRSVMAARLSSGAVRRVPSKDDIDSLRCEY